MKTIDWWGAYSDSLKGKIVDEAFSHPAKMAWGLTVRIFQHLFDEGWLKEGDLVADPFGGIGTTGLVASSFGCPCILIELEDKFVQLAEQNFELNREQWEAVGKPYPVVLQGDSRQFSSLIRETVDSIVTSPPYSETGLNFSRHGLAQFEPGYSKLNREGNTDQYGQSEGQLGGMPEGDHREVVSGIVTSPPYSSAGWKADEDPANPIRREAERRKLYPMRPEVVPGRYSANPENMGNLPEGSHQEVVDAVITSPPFEKQLPMQAKDYSKYDKLVLSKQPWNWAGTKKYGESKGQIGQEESETYWASVAQVYSECWKALKPGGVMAVVVKSFVRNKEIVDLPSQTLELLEAIGFEPLERIRAWMTSPVTQKSLMPDMVEDYTKKRASFFRRLYEKKYPENAIDFEEVLLVRKPCQNTPTRP